MATAMAATNIFMVDNYSKNVACGKIDNKYAIVSTTSYSPRASSMERR